MNHLLKILSLTIALSGIISGDAYVFAQSVPEASHAVCAYCGASLPNGVHSPGCPYYAGASKSSGSKSGSSSTDLNSMIVGTVFESLLTSIFSSSDTANNQSALAAQKQAAALAAQQAAAQKKADQMAAQAAYEQMMKSYKQLDNTQGAAFKTLSDSNLGYKSLDGDAEALAANARKPFDTASDSAQSGPVTTEGATSFFGDTMPAENIQFLVNPENNPNVVDLRNATTYVAENIKKDSEALETSTKAYAKKGKGEPIIKDQDCGKLAEKLNSFINQRNKFQKTINLAQDQLTVWEEANRNALVNGLKDGVEYFTGQLFERLAKRGEAAERLQQIYQKNAKQMAQEGLDVAGIEAKINRLRMMSTAGKTSEIASSINDWQTFVKDGMSSLLAQLTSSNDEVRSMYEDPRMKKYFETEAPELDVLLDISKLAASNKVFGKWVARKIPAIALIEISIKQAYNATDWFLSYQRISEANQINGKVMDTAKYIQKNIDETYLAIKKCPGE